MRAHIGWSSFEAQPTLKAGAAVQQAPKATWLRVVLLLLPFNLRSARLTRASDCKGTIFATPSGANPSVSSDGLKKNTALRAKGNKEGEHECECKTDLFLGKCESQTAPRRLHDPHSP
jgi:hypothetical protein